MTDLSQQLEDRKKGCGKTAFIDDPNGKRTFPTKCGELVYCEHCKAEIAILEQAIAEIKNKNTITLIKQDNVKVTADVYGLYDLYMMEIKENKKLKSEMQKQRQEILDKIDKIDFPDKLYDKNHINMYSGDIMTGWEEVDKEIKYIIKEQLNQPKTEKENSKQ